MTTWKPLTVCAVCLVAQSCPTLHNPMDCSPPGSSIHGDSPGKNTEMGCLALLQGIFPTQGLNSGLLIAGWFFTVWTTRDHNKLWKILREWEYQTTLPVSWETCMWVKKQQLEPYVEQWTGAKLEKEYEAVYCHPTYLTSKQSTSCEMLGWMNHKLESRLPGEISTTLDMQMLLL